MRGFVIFFLLLILNSITAYGQSEYKADDFREGANNGNAASQFCLGLCYEGGYGVEQDLAQAVYWVRKSAEQGYDLAQYSLGHYYFGGHGVLKDYNQAVFWFRKAAEQGNAEAEFRLGLCYQCGDGVAHDEVQGFSWMKKSAEQGNLDAQYNLGNCYYEGQGVEKDIHQAVHWWTKSAENGNSSAQNALGQLYLHGEGLPQDITKGVFWLRKAVEQGNGYAQNKLGEIYLTGIGVTQDYSEAVKLFRMSASQGNEDGQKNLGICYFNGLGVERDLNQVIYWCQKAVDNGIVDAPCFCDLAYAYASKKDYKNAHIYIDKAISINSDWENYWILKTNFYIAEDNIVSALEVWQQFKSHFPNTLNNYSEFCNKMLALENEMSNSVDFNIPISQVSSSNTFAFIIANEAYKRVSQVPFAKNDGNIFAEYCKNTLGIPEGNVKVWNDATLGDMQYAISKMQQIAEAYDGDANIILYYAGHGIPSDDQQNSYLLPIDGYNADDSSLSLQVLYDSLGRLNAKSVFVILDACFSGAQRNGEMFASTRGVAIKPKQNNPEGNIIVLSAAQGDETALPYIEKKHGLFSYFLMKKLKESEGGCTIGELSDYVIANVKRTSITIGDKLQTPKVWVSAKLNNWREIRLK